MIIFLYDKEVELVGGSYFINRATPYSLKVTELYLLAFKLGCKFYLHPC